MFHTSTQKNRVSIKSISRTLRIPGGYRDSLWLSTNLQQSCFHMLKSDPNTHYCNEGFVCCRIKNSGKFHIHLSTHNLATTPLQLFLIFLSFVQMLEGGTSKISQQYSVSSQPVPVVIWTTPTRLRPTPRYPHPAGKPTFLGIFDFCTKIRIFFRTFGCPRLIHKAGIP